VVAVSFVANAGFYTSTACLQIGAIPLYVDVDPSNLNISTAAVGVALAEEPSAVVVTHLYGQLAPIEEIVALCQHSGVPVVEDCAQAAGGRTAGGRAAGTVGAISAFSFYPTKNLAAIGDGGAIATRDRDIADRCRELRQYGWTARYTVERVGMNSRLDELQAAALRVRLPKLDARNARRHAICSAYAESVAGSAAITTVLDPDANHVGHLAVVRTAERDRLREHLASAGVGSDIHYPIADDQQPIWETFDHAMIAGSLPATHTATHEVLTVPCFPELSDHEVDRVAAALASFR
jgi:aminotransferase EvaB